MKNMALKSLNIKLAMFQSERFLSSLFVSCQLLMLTSAFGTALGFLIYSFYAIPSGLGFETEFWLFNWIPLIGSHIVIFFSSLGIQSLTFTVITEILPYKIRDVGLTFCTALFYGLTFLTSVLYSIAFDYLGLGILVIASGIICSAGAVYVHFKIPETKGKSHQEIMESL